MLNDKQFNSFINSFNEDELNKLMNEKISKEFKVNDIILHSSLDLENKLIIISDEDNKPIDGLGIYYDDYQDYVRYSIISNRNIRAYIIHRILLKNLNEKLKSNYLSTDYLKSQIDYELGNVYIYYHGKMVSAGESFIYRDEEFKSPNINKYLNNIIRIENLYIKYLGFIDMLIESRQYHNIEYIDFTKNNVKIHGSITVKIKDYSEKDLSMIQKVIESQLLLDRLRID